MDYDKLQNEVETNGAIEPFGSNLLVSKIMIDYLNVIVDLDEETQILILWL